MALNNDNPVRRGNWFEELALYKDTGVRYYPDPRDRSTSLLTTGRCIVHTERMEPKDYKSTTNSDIRIPQQHKDFIHAGGDIGPRQRLEEERIRKQIMSETKKRDDDAEAEKFIPRYETEKDLLHASGTTVSKQNTRVPTFNTNYSNDRAITFYSDAVNKGNVSFPVTFVSAGSNAFNRNAAFSSDIRDTNPKAAETVERPRHAPTFREFKVLTVFRERVISFLGANGNLHPIPFIVALIDDIGSKANENGKVRMNYFISKFTEKTNVDFTKEEIRAFEIEYDPEWKSEISPAEVLLLFRPTMSPKRLELVDLAFGQCDTSSSGVVGRDVVASVYVGSEDSRSIFIENVFGGREEAVFGDFVEHYSNVSAEVLDEDEFERILKETWQL